MWFLAIVLSNIGQPTADRIAVDMAASHYQTQNACLNGSRDRIQTLSGFGMHGTYLCMYHREPDTEMKHAVTGSF